MAEIVLTRGQVAIVDDADFQKVSQLKWHAFPSGKTCYARSGRVTLLHRFLLRPPQGLIVDHINGDGLDNRRANLRICNHVQNAANSGHRRNSKVPFRGVRLSRGRYIASMSINYRSIHIGSFATAEEAARAYDQVAAARFGEFALLNFASAAKEAGLVK